MAEIKSWIGGAGPYSVDNADVYPYDGRPMEGLRTTGTALVEGAPTLANHVTRLIDLKARGVLRVTVASLAAAGAELAGYDFNDAPMILARQISSSGFDASALFIWDSNATVTAPYIWAGKTGYWVAIAGRYVAGGMTISGALDASGATESTAVTDGGYVGLSGSKGRFVFDDETPADTITVKDADVLFEGDVSVSGTLTVPGGWNVVGDPLSTVATFAAVNDGGFRVAISAGGSLLFDFAGNGTFADFDTKIYQRSAATLAVASENLVSEGVLVTEKELRLDGIGHQIVMLGTDAGVLTLRGGNASANNPALILDGKTSANQGDVILRAGVGGTRAGYMSLLVDGGTGIGISTTKTSLTSPEVEITHALTAKEVIAAVGVISSIAGFAIDIVDPIPGQVLGATDTITVDGHVYSFQGGLFIGKDL